MCTYRLDQNNRHMNLYMMFHYYLINGSYATPVVRLSSRESYTVC